QVFDEVAYEGRKIIYSMLDCEKPIVGKVNGHAAGLGATLALFCDVIFVADHAKISDPHVRVGLAAGDGVAVIWPQLIGYARAKEYLMTGAAVSAPDAARMGLVNHAVPAAELDTRVDAFVRKLLDGATEAIRTTKMSVNVGLKQLAHTVLETSTALERVSNRSREHRVAIDAMRRKEAPVFRSRSLQVPAAVDADQLPRDVARLVGAQEGASGGDVVRGPRPADRRAGGNGIDARQVAGRLRPAGHGRVDEAGRN